LKFNSNQWDLYIVAFKSAFLPLCFYVYTSSHSAVSASLYVPSSIQLVCEKEGDWTSFIV